MNINLDVIQNIAINKIAAVISRSKPKDIIDLTWLFLNLFDAKNDFIVFFMEAVKREALLEEFLFVKGVFNYIFINSEKFLEIIKPSLIWDISSQKITYLFQIFEDTIYNLIKR